MAAASGANALAEAFPGRFVLGLGVSHKPAVEQRGSVYDRPLTAMHTYLDALDGSPFVSTAPAEPAPASAGA